MKKLLLTLIAAVSVLGAKAQWIPQDVPLTFTGYFNDIEVVDANTVWATLDSVNPAGTAAAATRKFAKTIDGGTTWTIGTVSASPAGYSLSNIIPLSADLCFVSMYDATNGGGAIYKTTDGGATWAISGANMFQQATSFTNVVHFFDAANGMVMGDPIGTPKKYEIWTTSDTGTTWVATPPANLPALTNAAEYGIVNLYAAADGRIWFATTYGDVYRSLDMGINWTKSSTGFPIYSPNGRQDITNIAFSDSLHGIAVQANATAILYRTTADGGLTWNPITPSGLFLPEVEGVPGSNIFVSCGSSGANFGSSYSLDFGLSWNTIDADSSHTCVDFINDSTGFSGRFRQLGSVGNGAWKFDGKLKSIPCGSPEVNAGTPNVTLANLCLNDTMVFTSPGAIAPNEGVVHGFGVLLSTTDISGLSNPIGSGFVLFGSNIITPTTELILINDGLIPANIYYVTPIVFGNATNPNSSSDISQFVLDTNCIVTGQSQMITIYAANDPNCTVGLNDPSQKDFTISNVYPVPVKDVLNFTVYAKTSAPVTVAITDMLGRTVYTSAISTSAGENKLSVSTANFNAGIYMISITNGKTQSVSKFVKD